MEAKEMPNVWPKFQQVMGYSDEELAKFRQYPKLVRMVQTPAFRTHKIVVEVIEAHGCIQHKVGDKLVLNANGMLLRDECPERMCVSLLSQLTGPIQAIWERLVAGLDPNGLLINTISCPDVGLNYGGYGRVLARIHVVVPEQDK